MLDTLGSLVGILTPLSVMLFGYLKLEAASKQRFLDAELKAEEKRLEEKSTALSAQQDFQDRLAQRDKEMGETIARLEERIRNLQVQLDAEISARRKAQSELAKAQAKLEILQGRIE